VTQILTVTMNPAIDVSTSVDKMAPFTKLRCGAPRHDPGGGGINVARVITRFGGDVAAIYPAGGATGQLLHRLMDREGVRSLAIPTSEETRQDFTVFEEATKQQYRFVLPGARLTERELLECLNVLAAATPKYIVASGSLPPGAPEDFFARVVHAANGIGARVVVDTSGPPLKAALEESIHLIKPNLGEFRGLTGVTATDDAALIDAARGLIERSGVMLVALTMGPQGALLISADEAWRADALAIEPASVVGAGDSFLGAMVWSLTKSDDLGRALCYGVAGGSAALLRPGTDLCWPDDVERLAPTVTLQRR
jgi:6-phosphofructokinase 2